MYDSRSVIKLRFYFRPSVSFCMARTNGGSELVLTKYLLPDFRWLYIPSRPISLEQFFFKN